MCRITAFLLGIALSAAVAAQQINRGDILSSLALRESLRDHRVTSHALFRPFAAVEQPISYVLSTGVGYSSASGGVSTASLPQELEIDFNRIDSVMKIDLDAYDWVRAPGANVSGVGDPAVEFNYRPWCSQPPQCAAGAALTLAGGVSIPSGTSVSAGSAAQMARIAWGYSTDSDIIKASLKFDHLNDAPPGLSSHGTIAKLYYEHDFSKDLDLFANLSYLHQSGADNVTTLGAGVDFPVYCPTGPFKKLTGEFSGACVVSGSHHCGRVELDFLLWFQ